jgi:hypothetical protein
MTLKDTDIATVRSLLLFMVGLSCLLYAVLAIVHNSPQPIWWYIPAAMGVLAGVGITIAFALADATSRQMASDEMYVELTHRAQRHAYWIALALYPIFAIGVFVFGLEWNTVFAAMGTLLGAAYLLLLTYYEWQMS